MSITKTCIVCGIEKRATLFRRNGYGTRKCKSCERLRFLRSRETSSSYESRECVSCGAAFRVLCSQLESGRRSGLYCSHECRSIKVALECACCRRQFFVMPCMVGRRKYCGQVCAGTLRTPEMITDKFRIQKHHMSRAWSAISDSIIERDGHACKRCGSGVDLVVHHIVSWRLTQDDSPSNLTTLCRSCHADRHRAPDGRLAGRVTS